MRSPEVLSTREKGDKEIEREREGDNVYYSGFAQASKGRGWVRSGGLINNKIRNQKLNECPFVIMPRARADNVDDDNDDDADDEQERREWEKPAACSPYLPACLPIARCLRLTAKRALFRGC